MSYNSQVKPSELRQGWTGQHQVCGLRDPRLAQWVLHLQHLQWDHGWQGVHPGDIDKNDFYNDDNDYHNYDNEFLINNNDYHNDDKDFHNNKNNRYNR